MDAIWAFNCGGFWIWDRHVCALLFCAVEPGISPPVLHNNQLSSSLQGREALEVDNGEDLARRAALMAALKALKEIDDLYAFKTRPR